MLLLILTQRCQKLSYYIEFLNLTLNLTQKPPVVQYVSGKEIPWTRVHLNSLFKPIIIQFVAAAVPLGLPDTLDCITFTKKLMSGQNQILLKLLKACSRITTVILFNGMTYLIIMFYQN